MLHMRTVSNLIVRARVGDLQPIRGLGERHFQFGHSYSSRTLGAKNIADKLQPCNSYIVLKGPIRGSDSTLYTTATRKMAWPVV